MMVPFGVRYTIKGGMLRCVDNSWMTSHYVGLASLGVYIYIHTHLCVWECKHVLNAHDSPFMMYGARPLGASPPSLSVSISPSLTFEFLLQLSLLLMPFLSLHLSYPDALSVFIQLPSSCLFFPSSPMCTSSSFLSSLLPSYHIFLHASQLYFCLANGCLQWLTA